MKQPVRTRFAPSPTGFMHVGGVRTALFAWLVARQSGGQFLLRIEDTDKAREVEGSIQHIIDSLDWLGLNRDEGVGTGGPYAPYLQSERRDRHMEWAQKLIEQDRAYADTRSEEELDVIRKDAADKKKPFLARDYRPEHPPKWEPGMPLRFKSKPTAYSWHDEVMGDIHTGPEVVDDFIIVKADGYPTYNFAHIIDDVDMRITHIMRGQEFVSSVPNYLNLYEALGITPPVMAHLPQILRPDGTKKLGKRDGAKDILDYAKDGYLPEAMLNFLASLGWNDGTEQEIFSKDELIQKFELDRVQRSGARFDEKRLEWMNGYHIRQLSIGELYTRAEGFWPEEAKGATSEYKEKILSLIQERLKYLAEIPSLTRFFFTDLPVDRSLIENNKYLSSADVVHLKTLLETARAELADSNFSVEDLTNRLNGLLGLTHTKPGVLFSLIRIATTEAPASPALADTLSVLGKDTSLRRIDLLLAAL
jgi:glutamyl-tRNA synthetase